MTNKDIMLNLFDKYGWQIKTGEDQLYGSVADIYAEQEKEQGGRYFMWIDDGNVSLHDVIYHIHVGRGRLDAKIFEGRIETKEEFQVVMKVLGFEKLKL